MSEETEEAYYVQRIEYLNSSFQKITYVKKIIELLAIISTMLLIICNFSYSPTTRSKIYQAKVTNLSLDSDNPHGIPFDIFTKKNSIWIKSEAAIFPGSRAIRYSDKVQAPQLQVKTQTTKRLLWSIFEPNRVVTSKDYYLILPVSDLK